LKLTTTRLYPAPAAAASSFPGGLPCCCPRTRSQDASCCVVGCALELGWTPPQQRRHRCSLASAPVTGLCLPVPALTCNALAVVLSSVRRWPSCFFLPAHADAPAAPLTLSFSCHWRQPFLSGPAQAPARLDPPRRPPLHSLRWICRCCGLPGRIHRCCGLLGSICRPFGRIVSSRPDPSFPFYSVAGADTMIDTDTCAVVGLPSGAP
jgi:hypothetical protein